MIKMKGEKKKFHKGRSPNSMTGGLRPYTN